MPDVLRLVETYELSPLPLPDDEELRLRLEVFRRGDGVFVGRVYRWEMYRLRPTFGEDEHGEPLVADEELRVLDYFFDIEDFEGDSPDDVLQRLYAKIDERFGTSR